MSQFREKRFIVTGSTSGIGQSVARYLLNEGATVIGVGRRTPEPDFSSQSSTFFFQRLDLVEDATRLPEWIREVSGRHGEFHGLVLAAGQRITVPAKAMHSDKTRRLFELNVFSQFKMAQAFFLPGIAADSGSSLVFVSSIVSHTGGKGLVDYSATKGAINSGAKSFALEGAKLGIRVNIVSPGLVDTPMLKNDRFLSPEILARAVKADYPLGLGRPEDVAHAICFLLSDGARWITGSELVVDGGASLG